MSQNEYDVNLRYGVDTQMSLAGKVAVVTGGLGGIAMAANQMLLEKGARLVLLYPAFEQERVVAIKQQLGRRRSHIRSVMSPILSRWPRPLARHSNAGGGWTFW